MGSGATTCNTYIQSANRSSKRVIASFPDEFCNVYTLLVLFFYTLAYSALYTKSFRLDENSALAGPSVAISMNVLTFCSGP